MRINKYTGVWSSMVLKNTEDKPFLRLRRDVTNKL